MTNAHLHALLSAVLAAPLLISGCASEDDSRGMSAQKQGPQIDGEVPAFDWAVAIDDTDRDLVGRMVLVPDGGVLAGDQRLGPTGDRLWTGEFPRGGGLRGALANNDIVVVGEKLERHAPNLAACELDIAGAAPFMAVMDGTTGNCSRVMELTSGEAGDGSELWGGFANDSEGGFVFRSSGGFGGSIEYHDYSGSRRWAVGHRLETGSYAAALHPDGGLVVAGLDQEGPLVVRHIDSTGTEISRHEIPNQGCTPIHLVSTHVSQSGAVVMAGLGKIHDPAPPQDMPPPRPDCLTVTDATGALVWRTEIAGRLLGAALVDDDHVLAWSQHDSLDGWTLASFDATGEPAGSWTLSAPEPYAHSGGLTGELLRRGRHVFVTGGYRDELDFGATQVGASEPMDYFVARFSLN